MMEVFVAALIVFVVAFLAMALFSLRGKQSQCLGCSCKAARQIMAEAESDEEAPCCREPTHVQLE